MAMKVIIRPTGDEEMSKHHLRTALANESFEELGKGKMTRYEFDVEFTLDETELLMWPRWVRSIRENTKVKEVKTYPNWVVRNFARGPVWEEFKMTNEEMHFMTPLDEYMKDAKEISKYGRKIKVKTHPKPWNPQMYQCKAKSEEPHQKIMQPRPHQ